eukprot:scaffold2298_cov104-Skeletonema_dohrnii-CCMP3373.AAC.9
MAYFARLAYRLELGMTHPRSAADSKKRSSKTGPWFFSTRHSHATGWMPIVLQKRVRVWCQKLQGLNLSAKPENPVQNSCPLVFLVPAEKLLAP